jgi:hypothetical protein
MGDLDAAIAAVKNEVDSLIIASGTSDAETIAARSGYSILQKRIDDVNFRTDVFLVDAAFNGLNTAFRFKTISAAMAACSGSETIRVAPGTYNETVTFTQDNITLEGAGAPSYDGTSLSGGTIIMGQIDTNGKMAPTIRNLGVDLRSGSSVDGINLSANIQAWRYGTFANLTLVGKGGAIAGNQGHGILCANGSGNFISHCRIYSFYHGIALRCSHSTISDCYIYGAQSNAIISKSDTGTGNADHNTMTNIILDGDPSDIYARCTGIRIQAFNSGFTTRFNTVTNVTSRNGGQAVVTIECVGTATVGLNGWHSINNVVSFNGGDAAIRSDFDLDDTTDNTFVNCRSYSRNAGYGVRWNANCVRNRFYGCNIDSSGAGKFDPAASSFELILWGDFGASGAVEEALIDGLYFTARSAKLRRIDLGAQMCGGPADVNSGQTKDMIVITRVGSGTTMSLAIDLMISARSGAKTFKQAYHIAIIRPNAATLLAGSEQIGTTLTVGTGTTGSVSIAIDTTTAETAKIQIVGAGSTSTHVAYIARIIAADSSIWTAQNALA